MPRLLSLCVFLALLPLALGVVAIPSDASYLDRAPAALGEQFTSEIGMARGEFQLSVPAVATRFSSQFTRKSYNAVVGTLSMRSEVGPITTSATIDPAHRVYMDAAFQSLGSRLSVQGVAIPDRNIFRSDNPRVVLDTTIPLLTGGTVAITVAGAISDPLAPREPSQHGPHHEGPRAMFRDEFEVAATFNRGELALAASTMLTVPASKGPAVALSSGARAGIEYKGVGVKVASEGSLLHILHLLQDEFDRMFVPEGRSAKPRAVPPRSDKARASADTVRCGDFWVEERPEDGETDIWTATLDKRVGIVDVGAAFSGMDAWSVGARSELPSGAVSARYDSSKRLSGAVSGRIGQLWMRLAGDIDLSLPRAEALASHRIGLRFNLEDPTGVSTSSPALSPVSAPIAAATGAASVPAEVRRDLEQRVAGVHIVREQAPPAPLPCDAWRRTAASSSHHAPRAVG